jgi:hypothetical protein
MTNYPNPAKKYIKIKKIEIGAEFEITNSIRQKLLSFETTIKEVSIDLTTFKSGFYTIKNSSSQGINTSKFIKN